MPRAEVHEELKQMPLFVSVFNASGRLEPLFAREEGTQSISNPIVGTTDLHFWVAMRQPKRTFFLHINYGARSGYTKRDVVKLVLDLSNPTPIDDALEKA